MKKMIKKLRLLLVIAVIIAPSVLTAQPGGPGDSTNNTNDANVPFDGGVSILVAAGIGYGLKKAHDKKKAEKEKL